MSTANDAPNQAENAASDAELRSSLARLVTANEFLTQWREKNLGPAHELLRDEPWIAEQADGVSRLAALLHEGVELERAGKTAASIFWRTQVEPLWSKVFSPDAHQRVSAASAKHRWPATGFEPQFVSHLLGLSPLDPLRYSGAFARDGVVRLWQDPPEVPPDDTAVVRQPLNPPIARCVLAPFQRVSAVKADSGPTINVSSAGAALVDGSGFASAMTLALIAMGGGASAAAAVGAAIDFPPGYERLRVSADIDVSWAGRSMTVVGAATASVNLTLQAVLPDGRTLGTTRVLCALPAPVLWFQDGSDLLRNQRLETGDIELGGAPGPVTILAGVEVYTAGVGIGGSSGARMSANFTVRNVCVSIV